MKILLLSFYVLVLFTFFGCKKYQAADAAFFITSNKAAILTSTAQGSPSSKITDLWFYVNGKFQGAFPVGNKMPVISKGNAVSLDIFAGIKNNGISGTRMPYIFFDKTHLDTFVGNGVSINRDVNFRYKTDTKFALVEGFDGVGNSFQKSSVSSDTIIKLLVFKNADSFENKSMCLTMSDTAPVLSIAQVETYSLFALPHSNSNVYLEMDYKCNSEIYVGLVGDNSQLKNAITLNPHDDWNKIYIQLAETVNSDPLSDLYKLYFKLLKTDDGTKPTAYFDNIKLIYL